MMLEVRDLSLYYGDAQALDGVSLDVPEGEIVAIVGANGAGKSSLIRSIAGIEKPRGGRIAFKGQDITGLTGESLRLLRRSMQLVFQDPYASLNPRMRVLEIIAEPMLVHGLIRKIKEGEDADDIFSRLMGDVVEPRREFIQANALAVANLDV